MACRHARIFLFTAALLFFIWENIAIALWATRFDSIAMALNHTWRTVTEDWLTLLILTDCGIFAILVIVWMIADTGQRGLSLRERWTWGMLAVLLGCPAILVYLGIRASDQRLRN